eukprot:TRINITY_DN1261_c0_g3_i1.p1 TRINITY_DN1261_c0_g3~~TRINITY_DN1261_c0_g3_i1.p1  ORF type:complete len:847 (+),score=359.99 TRINITY_DN1261_c0_g3_i1:44-2584(+)
MHSCVRRSALRHAVAQWQHRCASMAAVEWSDEKLELMKTIGEKLNMENKKGMLRLGKDFCDAFGVKHPKLQTQAKYLKILQDSYPSLAQSVPKTRKVKPVDTNRLLPPESTKASFVRTEDLVAANDAFRKKFDRVLILDFETTNAVYHNRKASPFLPSNRVVYTAWKKNVVKNGKKTSSGARVDGPFAQRKTYQKEFPSLKDVDCIVGHNLKFDLLFIWDDAELKAFFRRGGMIWDTMYAEYLLLGHNISEKLSLDALAIRYGGTVKDAFIKEQWDQGIGTEEIDVGKMKEYAESDVVNTELIFEQQLAVLHKGCRLPMIASHMDGLLATTEMEFNGLYVDTGVAKKNDADLMRNLEKAEADLHSTFCPPEIIKANKVHKKVLQPGEEITFNWGSPSQLNAYLFGGTVKYKAKLVKEEVAKKGSKKGKSEGAKKPEVKYSTQDVIVEFKGIVPNSWKEKNSRYYNENTDRWQASGLVIESIAETHEGQDWAAAIGKLNYIKHMKKISATYLQPFTKMVDAHSLMRPNLNHTLTRTGRLSSNNPNMQNIPRQGVKQCLVSRFHGKDGKPEGRMVESDYSQLEVFVNALLSQDETLMAELESGADLHCKRLARMRNKPYEEVLKLCKVDKDPYWTDQRTKAKVFSFQRQYGAGISTVALSTGLDRREVEMMVELEKKAYHQVERFFECVTMGLHETAKTKVRPDHGWYDAPSGNRWYFEQTPARFGSSRPGQRPKMEFKKQLILNHPVQGFAAEIVLTCLGKLWRRFLANANFSKSGDFSTPARGLMVNTVHDCVWVDAHNEVVDEVMKMVDEVLQDVKGALVPLGYHIPRWIGFRTDTHQGMSMADI